MTKELTQEQIDAFINLGKAITDSLTELCNGIAKAFDALMKYIQEFGIRLGRALFRMQLLRWKIPAKLSSFIAERIYWKVACHFGYRWLSLNFKKGFAVM